MTEEDLENLTNNFVDYTQKKGWLIYQPFYKKRLKINPQGLIFKRKKAKWR